MDARTATIPSAAAAAAAISSTATKENKPKPCCVCKEEKSKRDECMLFSNAKDPVADCKSFIEQYRSCMSGFGYQV
ncbi:cysteine alpha-hairpin motif superfamily [Mariannaea sp. PMI_226]|nr:cysteine alpha-hairpin motif superfamily [Mariannaea sp. PMI_226]